MFVAVSMRLERGLRNRLNNQVELSRLCSGLFRTGRPVQQTTPTMQGTKCTNLSCLQRKFSRFFEE